jgi:6-phosphogluconolactonase
MAVSHSQTGQARITLTPPALNAGATVAFLVSGPDKAEAVRRVLTEPPQPDVLPAQIIQPEHGQLIWMLDNAAAALL